MTIDKVLSYKSGEPFAKKYQPDVLNVLRVLGTLMVFLLHGNTYIEGVYKERNLFSFLVSLPAWGGVWIFLFLGGYLFAYGAENNRYPFKNQLKFVDVIDFYWHRFIRLAPIYYLYIIFFEFFTDYSFLWNNPQILLKILTFTYNGEAGVDGIGHLWYISISMQMYLIMPFIYYALSKIRNKNSILNLFFMFVIVGLTFRILRVNHSWYSDVYTCWFCNLDFTICGILLAMLKKRCLTQVKPNILFKKIAFYLFLFLIIFNCWIYFNINEGDNLFIYCYILPTVYILDCSCVLIVFQGNEGKIKKKNFLNYIYAAIWRGINAFSKYSYGFYVFHIAAFMCLNRTLLTLEWYINSSFYLRYFLFFILAFVVSLLISTLFIHGAKWDIKTNKSYKRQKALF